VRLALAMTALVALVAVTEARAMKPPPPKVERALRHAADAYRVPYREMRAVSWCESRWDPAAVGDGSRGLFQFLWSTWFSTPYKTRYIYSAWWNALAAGWLWRHDGGSWREWTCQP
jgi:soluble lytic murein transglycosylase-like protein